MKKILIGIGLVITIIIATPVIVIFGSYLVSDLRISGISGNIITGIKIKNLNYKNIIVAKNTYIYPSATIKIGNLHAKGLNLSNTIAHKNANSIQITTNIGSANITGKLFLIDDKAKFIGYWHKAPYDKQKLSIIYDNEISAVSNGNLGTIHAKKDSKLNKISWQVNELQLAKIINCPNQLLISGTGEISQDQSGFVNLNDGHNNLNLKFSKDSLKAKLSMPKASYWLQNIDSIKSTFDFYNNNLESHIMINTTADQKLNLDIHNNLIRSNLTANKHSWAMTAKLNLRENFKISDLLKLENMILVLSNRFSSFNKATKHKEIDYSTLAISSTIPNILLGSLQGKAKSKMPINAVIHFNLLEPEHTKISFTMKEINLKSDKNTIDIKKAEFKSNTNSSDLKIHAYYNLKPVDIYAKFDKRLLSADISAEEISLPISHNVSLIISPKITINNFGNFNNVTGYINILGGYINSDYDNSLVRLPDNTIIIGEKKPMKPLDWLLPQLTGQLTLTTIKPVNIENISGLSGDLWGELILKLENNTDPKFTGNVTVKNAKYLRNKKINIIYARASYEHNLINNPMLDVKLSRAIDKQSFQISEFAILDKKEIVGVNIRGNANQPEITTYSNNQNLSKLQIMAALETGSTSGIGPEQGMMTLFSMFKKHKSPVETLQEQLNLDEIYFTSNQGYGNDLINPNLGGSSIVLSKTFFDKVNASYIASLHNKDYLLTASYPITDNTDIQIYSSRYTNPQIARSSENYGFNLLWYKSIK